ncbi:MAG TPA: ParB/RepB/Spo0J family partition protein [Candidatus Saccharimonadales bacterium]|nr:ParB/RepB/Spo0J family partition protein [Candidatus Saccharimonadales bacterium]
MASSKQRGLGTSFSTLIPQGLDVAALAEDGERVQKLALDVLEPNPDQPRQHFDPSALDELAQSIKQYGVVQPLVASPDGKKFRIIAGERRWRAARLAGLKQVPVIVRTSKELEQLEIAIIENVQRVDLSPLEQAVSIERLHSQFNLSYEEIAKRLGKANSTVVNIVRLLQLPDDAKEALLQKQITEGHARQILALKKLPEKQAELLELILKHSWNVRQAERYVTSHKEGVTETEQAHERVQTETPATKALSKRLGTKVAVKRMAHGGRLEITFKDDEHLQKLLESLDN